MTLQMAESLIRKIRQRIFDYYDESEAKGQKASRILAKLLAVAAKLRPAPPVDQWGATAQDRRDLARHGLTWMD